MQFSIDWPPRFESRTCDPTSPHYVGKRPQELAERKQREEREYIPVPGSRAYEAIAALKRAGEPMLAPELAMRCLCAAQQLTPSLSPAIRHGLVIRIKHNSRSVSYALPEHI